MEQESWQKSIKRKLLTGLFITFPAVLSVIAIIWLFELLDGILGHELKMLLGQYYYPGTGLVLSVLGVYMVGVMATTVLGKTIIERTERMILRLPVFKSFYSTFKQLGDAFSPENRSAFKKFVIVEYPRLGVHSFGFLTKECVLKNDLGEEECYNTVYVPTNNLYLGEVILFKKDEVVVTDMSIEEGIKILLSAGIAAPNIIQKTDHNHARHEAAAPRPFALGQETRK
jgi:uncharacterized membrane protein